MTLVEQFERGTLPPSQFHHAQHLEVALWYGLHYTSEEALARMCASLRNYLAVQHVPAQKYSLPVTVAWMARVQSFLLTADRSRPFADLLADFRAAVAHLPPALTVSATIEKNPS